MAEEAAKNAGDDYMFEKVTDIEKIISFVITTPVFVVDGKLKYSGKVPSMEQIVKMQTE